MKRRVFTIIVFLLLGAIVNVAVAWSISYFKGPFNDDFWNDSLDRSCLAGEGSQWHVVRHAKTGSLWVMSTPRFAYTGNATHDDRPQLWLPTWAALQMTPTITLSGSELNTVQDSHFRSVHATGWPALSLYGLFGGSFASSVIDGSAISTSGTYFVSNNEGGMYEFPRAVPLRPIWPGFAINTLFYAAILAGGWGLFAAPFALRRRRRIKHGLCPKCAYPVGASEVCTECGAVSAVSDQRAAISLRSSC